MKKENTISQIQALEYNIEYISTQVFSYVSKDLNKKTPVIEELNTFSKNKKVTIEEAVYLLVSHVYCFLIIMFFCNAIKDEKKIYDKIFERDLPYFYFIDFFSQIFLKLDPEYKHIKNVMDTRADHFVNHYFYKVNNDLPQIQNYYELFLKLYKEHICQSSPHLLNRIINDLRYILYSIMIFDENITENEKSAFSTMNKTFYYFEEMKLSSFPFPDNTFKPQNIQTETKIHHSDDYKNELDSLIGLESIKSETNKLESYIKIQSKRIQAGLPSSDLTLHFVFSGRPGTGKTTVARILGNLFKEIGFLEKGHVVETDRSGLVGGYIGQTAIKTAKKLDEALDGVLFIDEAYTLARDDTGYRDSYGSEAIDTVVKYMEDNKDRIVVVVAGYPELINDFVNSNPGLRSRFTRYFHFEDYSPDQLYQIFNLFCNKYNYSLSPVAEELLQSYISYSFEHRDDSFGNARFVRKIFEKAIQQQAFRLSRVQDSEIGNDELIMLEYEDICIDEVKKYLNKDNSKID